VVFVSTLDHLVIAAEDLAEGVRWVEERVGAALEPGGRHTAFGTHNALLSLGPECYLEVIAVDPAAPPPARPRWFELDTPAMCERLARGPALVHWVVRVDTVDEITDPLELSRGDNHWVLGVPPEGRMLLGGLAPSRILWRTPPPPTRLPDKGIRLQSLELTTPDPAKLRHVVAGVVGPVLRGPGSPGLAATLVIPSGRAVLRG